jgi:two-component system NtrC family sensor kinase
MRLGTKSALYLCLIIIIVFSGYGYFHIVTRRDILTRKMKVEVRSIGRTLKVPLEKISLPREMEYLQELIDTVEEYEKTLGIVVYHQARNLTFRSRSLREEIEPYLVLIKKSIQEDLPQEEFRVYKKDPVFAHAFPLKNRTGKNIGGVAVLQYTSFMDKDMRRAEWSIFIAILILMGGTVTFVLFGTRKWISEPISQLMGGVKNLAKGHFNTHFVLSRKDEISELAQAFNQMAVDLKGAQERIVQEAETKLELERGLRQSEKLATIGQLASGLAHEMGTPLNIIGGRAELMKKKMDAKEGAQKNLDIIIQQTERITKIIQQLLGFVRKKKPEWKVIPVKAILKNTLDFLDHQIRRQGVSVAEEIEDNLPPVLGDSDQLQQVFLNLILNAIQAMPEGGTLRVSASSKRISKEEVEGTERPCVEVSIEDTGMGMVKEALANIFNPFFTTKDTGTGLGLMVSQGIIQDHEGWIDVKSEIGKGSVFKVYIPCFSAEVKGDG